MIKHSVLMITFNQEALISKALDSILSQSILPYEIIISDDCSTDNTWQIILHYCKNYPTLIKAKKQDRNKGIYANVNSLAHLPTGDIVSYLSGDDLYKPGIFESFNETILEKELDPIIEKFILISNSVTLTTKGDEIIFSNYCLSEKDLFKMKIRNDLNFRETGFSIKLFKELPLFDENIGLHADFLHSLEQIELADNFYFIDRCFPVYRMGTGLVSKTKQQVLAKSRLLVLGIIVNKYRSKLDFKDRLFIKYQFVYYNFLQKESFARLLKLFCFLSINIFNFTPNKTFISELRYLILLTVKFILERIGIYNYIKTNIKNR